MPILLLFLLLLSTIHSFSAMTTTTKTLYDIPVSNNGARCRIILYKKEIPDVSIVSPMEIGGLKSEEYLKINPQGKMPALVVEDGLNLAESDTIARYLLSEYASLGPSFQPDNPRSNLLCRYHDMYITTIQNCMYKAGPFGRFGTRREAIHELVQQLHYLDDLVVEQGVYLCGSDISLADATVFPTLLFCRHMLPKFDETLPPKLEQYVDAVQQHDPVFRKVHDEIMGGLQGWEDRNRWDSILGAGWKDTEPSTIFDKIVSGDIPSTKVLETEHVLAFKDINPAAPAHVLVIPKVRNGLTRLTKATDGHAETLGRLMVAAAEVARNNELGFGDGARIVINDGPDGGQEVPHLHVHVLGGRSMQWPPG